MCRLFLGTVALVMLLSVSGQSHGQSVLDRLVMPGHLSNGHAKYEKQCEKCHKPFDKKAQTGLCLDCHDKIGADRKTRKGFHGKSPAAARQICKQCHTEHKGRTADIIGLDRETFDHTLTNFTLTGKHAATTCNECHKPGVTFRKASAKCVSCHEKAEPHKGRLGKNCQSCHTTKAWRPAKAFDHSKTKFALVGNHRKVQCRGCHAGEKYKGVATTCFGCHALQDTHKGTRGRKCESCHQPTTWKKAKFDHTRDTKFPLRGAHAKAQCESCHRGRVYAAKLPLACNGCHGKSDPHKGQLGRKCEKCHNENGWRTKVGFNHDLTRFPLIGLHATVSCESCHKSKAFRNVSRSCTGCHADEFHRSRLGTKCAQCHTPNGWRRWMFNHTRQTQFPLTGAHENLDCHACHNRPASGRLTAPKSCIGCHRGDDVHGGSFGQNCAACHATATFRSGRMRAR